MRIKTENMLFSIQEYTVYAFYNIFKGFRGPVLMPDYLLPIPLVYINRMKAVQLLVPANSIHVGI